jgi:hypothetical protein
LSIVQELACRYSEMMLTVSVVLSCFVIKLVTFAMRVSLRLGELAHNRDVYCNTSLHSCVPRNKCRVHILSENYRLLLPAATLPHVWTFV